MFETEGHWGHIGVIAAHLGVILAHLGAILAHKKLSWDQIGAQQPRKKYDVSCMFEYEGCRGHLGVILAHLGVIVAYL
jgi:hypothetical protein